MKHTGVQNFILSGLVIQFHFQNRCFVVYFLKQAKTCRLFSDFKTGHYV